MYSWDLVFPGSDTWAFRAFFRISFLETVVSVAKSAGAALIGLENMVDMVTGELIVWCKYCVVVLMFEANWVFVRILGGTMNLLIGPCWLCCPL